MDSPKRKKTYIFLIVINAVLMFFFAGMPKFYLNKAHFYENIPLERSVYDTYRTRVDIVLKDKNGKDVSLPSGTKIYTLDIYVLDVLGDDPEVSKKEPQRISAHCDSPEVEFTMSKSYLQDKNCFENITRQELQEQRAKDPRYAEADKKFSEYMLKQRLWVFYPQEYPWNYFMGLIVSVFSVILGVSLYRNKSYEIMCGLLPLLSILKIAGIIYFYLNPLFCG
jgi:hypothetical protein